MFKTKRLTPKELIIIMSSNKTRKYCIHFNTEKGCKYGDNCIFEHPTKDCSNFDFETNTGCKFGDKCTFSHKKLNKKDPNNQSKKSVKNESYGKKKISTNNNDKVAQVREIMMTMSVDEREKIHNFKF